VSFLLDTDVCSADLKGDRTVGNRVLQFFGGMTKDSLRKFTQEIDIPMAIGVEYFCSLALLNEKRERVVPQRGPGVSSRHHQSCILGKLTAARVVSRIGRHRGT